MSTTSDETFNMSARKAREIHTEFKKAGMVNRDYPPQKDSKYYNRRIETLPRNELDELKNKNLRIIINWAYQYSKFYHRKFDESGVRPDEIKTFDDLPKIPVIRKEDLRQDQVEFPPYGSMAAEGLLPYVTSVYTTSGTTGKPTIHPWTDEEYDLLVEWCARHVWATGLRPGYVFFNLIPAGRLYIYGVAFYDAAKRCGAKTLQVGSESFLADVEGSVKFISEFEDNYVTMITPILLIRIGETLKNMRVESPYVALQCAGMPLTPRIKEKLQELHPKVGDNVFNVAGNVEGFSTCECVAHSGRHFWEDVAMVEVVDPKTGERVAEGERGELVLTQLYTLTLPLIRYSLGDIVENTITYEQCECGRTHGRFLEVLPGRLKDIVTVRGKQYLPFDVESVVAKIPDITLLYQLIIEADVMDTLKVRVETRRKLPDREYETMVKSTLEKELGVPVEVALIPPGTVPIIGYKAKNVLDFRKK